MADERSPHEADDRENDDHQTDDPLEHRQRLMEFALILGLIVIVALLALVFLDDALADLLAIVGESVE